MTEIRSWRKKSVTIRAVRWDGTHEGAAPIVRWVLENGGLADYETVGMENGRIMIDTLEGRVGTKPGDYVIQGIKGEFYPHSGEFFNEAFDPAEDDLPAVTRGELSHEILDAVREESARAHAKHVNNGGSIFDPRMPTERKLAALVEEVGEVGNALTYDFSAGEDAVHLRLIEELVQVANVALTWADCLSDQLEGDV